jgi:hypothetical protein
MHQAYVTACEEPEVLQRPQCFDIESRSKNAESVARLSERIERPGCGQGLEPRRHLLKMSLCSPDRLRTRALAILCSTCKHWSLVMYCGLDTY